MKQIKNKFKPKLGNFEQFKGRVLSSSYIPQSDNPIYPEMISALKQLFDKHQVHNQVTIDYDTELYYGQLDWENNRNDE